MKTDSTPPPRRRQAENPPPARSTRHRTLARAGLHRLQHPLRGRRQDPGHRLRRHRRHPTARPQARPGRGHRRAAPPAQVPPPLPRESDHVLNFAYNALCNGTCLDDIELRRNDVVFLDALGADRIPDPTTAGDFCRRFTPDDVETLQDVFDQTRLKVWKQQPPDFFDEAVLDVDGTLVATGAGCKQGMDIAYDGTWGYHPLIVSLANTGEVLSIVNRPGNRPSHEGAAEQLDLAILLCRQAGFRRIYLRGDTDFTQTKQLDAWDAEGVTFLFGIDAMPNLKAIAEDLPASAWAELRRPPQYTAKGKPRTRPERVKDRIVRERGFETLTRVREDVAEVAYRPTACQRTYRLIIVRQTIAVEKGQARLFDEIRYRFYLTNDREARRPGAGVQGQRPLRPGEPDRATEGRRPRAAGGGGQPGEQLGVHGDDGVGVEPEGVVRAVGPGAPAAQGGAPRAEASVCCGWSSSGS